MRQKFLEGHRTTPMDVPELHKQEDTLTLFVECIIGPVDQGVCF